MGITAYSRGSAEPAASILERLKGVDGANSGLDADQLDGYEAAAFALAGHNHDTDYAPAAQGVTGGDSHDHSGGDGAQISHASLGSITADDHHTRYTDAEAVAAVNAETSLSVDITGDADTVDGQHASAFAAAGHGHSHGDLSGIGASDHHTRYTDSEAVAAINADADHGSTAQHDYFSGSHGGTQLNDTHDLNNISDGWYQWTSNVPANAPGQYMIMLQKDDGSQSIQIAIGNSGSGKVYVRRRDSGTFYPWTEFSVVGHGHSHGDLTGIGASDHHARYTDEEARDAIAAALVGGGDVSISVDDGANTITITCNNTDTNTWRPIDDTPVNGVTDESISSNWAYNHTNNASAHHTRYTDAEARSAVEAGAVNHVSFANIESSNLPDTGYVLGYDHSDGFYFKDSGAVGLLFDTLKNKPSAGEITGLGSQATENQTISTGSPSGGSNGDVWYKV